MRMAFWEVACEREMHLGGKGIFRQHGLKVQWKDLFHFMSQLCPLLSILYFVHIDSLLGS